MKYLFTSFIFLGSFLSLAAQKTYVPDDNFEQRLIDLGLDDVLDDYVLTSNISGFQYLDIGNKGITNLTGLEDFASLKGIILDGNPVNNMPFHANVNLEVLSCQSNQLTNLDLSPHTNLVVLLCARNNLTTLDLSQNPNLQELICGQNQLSEITMNSQINLYLFECISNNLSSLDLSQHISLAYFYGGQNQFSELDLSNNTNLLEVSSNNSPILQFVDIRNGNNTNISRFDFRNSPNLPYIYVDDCVYSTTNWINIDPTTIFVEVEGQTECEMIGIGDNFLVQSLDVYPNPVKDFIYIKSVNGLHIEAIAVFSISGKKLKTLYTDFEKIDFKSFSTGVYYLKIQSNQGTVVKKVLKN